MVKDILVTVPEAPVEFAMPLREVEVMVIGRHREMGLLDEGSEIVIIRGDLCDELGVKVGEHEEKNDDANSKWGERGDARMC